jgi:hypothetical protein
MRIEMPNIGHRNAVPFEGIAMFVDTPLDGKIHWTSSETKQVVESPNDAPKLVFRREAAERALPSFLGMGICAQEGSLENHAIRSKVGFISEAFIEGNAVMIRGFIYGVDYPDMVDAIKKLRTKLGMCVKFADMVGEWPTELKPEFGYITDFLVSGVAILHRTKCGFSGTTVRILPQSYKWACAESGCPHFMNGEVQGFCSEHQPKR